MHLNLTVPIEISRSSTLTRLSSARKLTTFPPMRSIRNQCTRTFSTTCVRPSNIGMARLQIPDNVNITIMPPPPPKLTKYFKPSPRHHPLGGPSVRESDAQTIVVAGPLGRRILPFSRLVVLISRNWDYFVREYGNSDRLNHIKGRYIHSQTTPLTTGNICGK